MKEIKYSKLAIKFLKKRDMVTRKRIVNAINHLPAGDVKKLQGEENYRLRVGDYHIVFNNDGFVLYIIRIDSRRQVYKRYEVFICQQLRNELWERLLL